MFSSWSSVERLAACRQPFIQSLNGGELRYWGKGMGFNITGKTLDDSFLVAFSGIALLVCRLIIRCVLDDYAQDELAVSAASGN